MPNEITKLFEIRPEHRNKTSDYSKLVAIYPIELSTNEVQIVFERYFSHTDKALYAITKAVRGQGRRAKAIETEKKLSEVFDSFSRELHQAFSALDKEEGKVGDLAQQPRIVFDNVRHFDAPVRTGFGRRLMNLTCSFDQFVSAVTKKEINNEITPAEAADIVDSWRKRYIAFCVAIQRLRDRAGEDCKFN